MTRYGFSRAMAAFFLADSRTVSSWLPEGLHPSEARPGHAVVAVTAFDFVESEVGAYGELVLSAMVRPFARSGDPLPHAATFPIVLATTSEASRIHATERWCLPQHSRCLDIVFGSDGTQRTVTVHDGDTHVLTLTVSHLHPETQTRLYQAFSKSDAGVHRVNLDISGEFAEHQDQTGRLELSTHPLIAEFEEAILDDDPYLEQSMAVGEQRFGDLTLHGGAQ
jgi:hypothetical protein